MSIERERAVDLLTTHRHGEDKEACDYCAAYYGGIWDALAPIVASIRDEAWTDGHNAAVATWIALDARAGGVA